MSYHVMSASHIYCVMEKIDIVCGIFWHAFFYNSVALNIVLQVPRYDWYVPGSDLRPRWSNSECNKGCTGGFTVALDQSAEMSTPVI